MPPDLGRANRLAELLPRALAVGAPHRVPRRVRDVAQQLLRRTRLEPEVHERAPGRVPDAFGGRDEPPYHQHFLKLTLDPAGPTVERFPSEEYGEPWIVASSTRTIRIDA